MGDPSRQEEDLHGWEQGASKFMVPHGDLSAAAPRASPADHGPAQTPPQEPERMSGWAEMGMRKGLRMGLRQVGQGGGQERLGDFIFLDSKITADCVCSHEIKRCLFLGR